MYYGKPQSKKGAKKDTDMPRKKQPDLKAKLDRYFSLYIRYRDTMPNGYFRCISCGQVKPFAQGDAGHYVTRACFPLRWNEHNVNMQCTKCNRFLNGNLIAYRQALIDKYGEPVVEYLEYKSKSIAYFSREELKQMIEVYKSLGDKIKKEKGL